MKYKNNKEGECVKWDVLEEDGMNVTKTPVAGVSKVCVVSHGTILEHD